MNMAASLRLTTVVFCEAVIIACFSVIFFKTSPPGVPLNFVPTNAATGLDFQRDYYHPETAVVGAGTGHPHIVFQGQDLRITNGFSWIPREHRPILRTASTITGLPVNKVLISIHCLVLPLLQSILINPGQSEVKV